MRVTVRVPRIPSSLSVAADPQRLKQVLLNIVTNAIKYNRRGGRVEISAVAVDGHCRLAVSDTGPGLRAEERKRLFAPFERLSAGASDVEGTGLGLALSKGLTEAMGEHRGGEQAGQGEHLLGRAAAGRGHGRARRRPARRGVTGAAHRVGPPSRADPAPARIRAGTRAGHPR